MTASRNRTRNVAAHCEVALIGRQIEGLWREHDRIDALGENGRKECMERLFDATETLKSLASFTRTNSLEGALFQVRLAFDCLNQLRLNQLDESQQENLYDTIDRLLCSVVSAIGSKLPSSKASIGKRYHRPEDDSLVLFERARRPHGVGG